MLDQHGIVLSDHVEDIRGTGKGGRIQRMIGRIAQLRPVERGDLKEVSGAQQALYLEDIDLGRLVEAELGRQHPAVLGAHVLGYTQAHDRREFTIPELGLDERHEVVGLFFGALRDGIAGDAKELARVDRHTGEEQVQMFGDKVFERDEDGLVSDLREPRDPGARRHLDADERRPFGLRAPHRHEKIDGQVRDEREGVCRIDGQRRDEREDVAPVVIPKHRLFLSAQ